MPSLSRVRSSRGWALLAVLACALLVSAGCGIDTSDGRAQGSSDAAATAAPELSTVEPLADPRDWEGAVTAGVAQTPVDPVSTDAPRLPVTLTDAQGTRVTVGDASRVLALDVHGTLARTVFELGLGDRLVGRDVSTQFPEAADLPLVTQGGHDLNAEAILALDPTLIITDTSLGPWDVVLQMRDAGIPVVVVDSERSLGNVGALIEQTAQALGVPAAGQRLATRTARAVDEVVAQIEKVAPAEETERLRAVFLYVRGNAGVYYMFGTGSPADSLFDAVGAYDVAEEIGWSGMKPVTDEGLIAAQPEVIVMMSHGLESADGVDGLLERLPALAQTPAGLNERFVDMEDSLVLGYGPRTAEVLNALAVALHAPAALS